MAFDGKARSQPLISASAALRYKTSFIDSCISRDEPDSPAVNRVAEIKPKVDEPTVRPGLKKLGWFKASNASARICRFNLSFSLVLFESATSRFENPGPVIALRPRLPNVPPLAVWS